jgi:TPP-dependent pyruvate/acetoin dehydrogenase alpha subunit
MRHPHERLSTESLLVLYKKMVTIRKFEEKVYYLFLQRILPGTIHQYIGQEAVATGVCANLNKDDFITSTHRPHGHALAKGVSVRSAFAELYAKPDGCCHAKGGSMHMGDPQVGMIPAIAIVGGGLTVSPGLALAFKLKHTKQVATCFFGEGASNEGAFHEGVNFAAVKQLPIVFVCENNLWAVSTPFSLVSLVENVADRCEAYGIPGIVVDGMDVLAVYDAAHDAVKRARDGGGPTLLEAKTYRFCGHSRFDPRTYRTKGEEEQWAKRDPISSYAKWLVDNGVATHEDLAQADEMIESEIEEAVSYAAELPDPEPTDALKDVFA